MDNLTHSLLGALLGQAGLKRRTGLAMPALIIGANLPDIDGVCMLLGTQGLALRRGLTHGPIAWPLLPLVLAAILWGYDRWQARRGKRPEARRPVRVGQLYLLALIACMTHPVLDWLNSYGIRFLAPFNQRWFYGDALFIIDIWLWLGLGFATWLSMRREDGGEGWRTPARMMLGAAVVYVGVNLAITYWTESKTEMHEPYPSVAIANPTALTFWRREMISGHGNGLWRVNNRTVGDIPLERCDLTAARLADEDVDAFLIWSRAPFVKRMPSGEWSLGDARFSSRAAGRFAVVLPPETCRLAATAGSGS